VTDDLPYVPDPDGVARLLAIRTVDDSGNEIGAWTDNTRPPAEQVFKLCRFAAEDLAARLGTAEVPFELYDECRRAAALQAAALVLVSFYPEAATGAGGQISTFTAMYLNAAGQLQDRVWRVPLRLPSVPRRKFV
jgi:hypothetical protein